MHLSRSSRWGPLIVLLALTACSPVRQTAAPTTISQPAATPTVLPTRTSTVVTTTRNCPPSSNTQDIAPQFFGRVAGQSPVWVVFGESPATIELPNTPESWTEHGHPIKRLWVVETTYAGTVTIQGGNLNSGEPIWFQIQGQDISTTSLLDPHNPPIPFQHEGFADFPSYIFIPEAGCYFFEVITASDSWRMNFTVTE